MELQKIQTKIYEIRGYKVMLDFDLAEMYQVETRRLKEQVKRNIERFPIDFMFLLTKEEWKELIAKCDNLPENIKHSPVPPSAFTQEGVAMLSGILRSPIAIQVNINIMRAFVAIRQMLLSSAPVTVEQLNQKAKEIQEYIDDILKDQNDINQDTHMQIELINEAIAELQVNHQERNKSRRPVGFVQYDKENKAKQ